MAKAFREFDGPGRMKLCSYYERLVDAMKELLTRASAAYVVDRYSERKESADGRSVTAKLFDDRLSDAQRSDDTPAFAVGQIGRKASQIQSRKNEWRSLRE